MTFNDKRHRKAHFTNDELQIIFRTPILIVNRPRSNELPECEKFYQIMLRTHRFWTDGKILSDILSYCTICTQAGFLLVKRALRWLSWSNCLLEKFINEFQRVVAMWLLYLHIQRRKIKRKCWIHPISHRRESSLLFLENYGVMKTSFLTTSECVLHPLTYEKLENEIQHQNTKMRYSIPSE